MKKSCSFKIVFRKRRESFLLARNVITGKAQLLYLFIYFHFNMCGYYEIKKRQFVFVSNFLNVLFQGSKSAAPYYMGSTASLPRGATLLRTYSPAVGGLPADRLKPLPTGIFTNNMNRQKFFLNSSIFYLLECNSVHARCCKTFYFASKQNVITEKENVSYEIISFRIQLFVYFCFSIIFFLCLISIIKLL